MVVPDALPTPLGLSKQISKAGVPQQTLELVHLRTSQINGCAARIHMHARDLGTSEETDERFLMAAAWREATCFSDAERAVLALDEAVTRLSDRPDPVPDEVWDEAVTRLSDRADPVPDEVWDEAARHYSEQELGGLVMHVGLVNFWNRMNVTTRQVPGAYGT